MIPHIIGSLAEEWHMFGYLMRLYFLIDGCGNVYQVSWQKER